MATVENYLSRVNKGSYKKASGFLNHIREFEEDEDGRYIAFVDDGPNSYDVNISIDKKGDIQYSQCDCGKEGGNCHHILACLIYYSKSQLGNLESVSKKKIVRKKKVPVHIAFVQQVDTASVINWLAEELKSNKKLKVKFKNDLINKNEVYSIADLENTYEEVVKSIKGRKRTITVKECGEIIKLIKPIYLKILDDQLAGSMHQQVSKDTMEIIFKQIDSLHYLTVGKSGRLETLERLISEKYIYLLSLVKVTETQESVLIHTTHKSDTYISLALQVHIIFSFKHMTRESLLVKLKILVKEFSKFWYSNSNSFLGSFITFFKEKEVLDDIIKDLPIVMYANEYNLSLLDHKYKLGFYESVIGDCELIYENYHPYYASLYDDIYYKSIFEIQDTKEYLSILTKKFLESPNDHLFLLIKDKISEIELSEFYSKIINSNKCTYGTGGFRFRLEALIQKGQFAKIYTYMNKYMIIDEMSENSIELIAKDNPLKMAIFLHKNMFYSYEKEFMVTKFYDIAQNHLTLDELKTLCDKTSLHTVSGQKIRDIYKERNK